MTRKVLIILLGLSLAIGALTIFVAVPVAGHLFAARRALGASPQNLSPHALTAARAHLESVEDNLSSTPARILELVPLARQNLRAVRAAATASVPVLDAGARLRRASDLLIEEGVIRRGAVRVKAVTELRGPLEDQAEALEALSRLRRHRNGWLVPPLWDALDEIIRQGEDLGRSARQAARLTGLADGLLGGAGPRTYLILMLNNAELRGAGGILSGIGTVTLDRGKLRLGPFRYYRDLADPPPYRSVPAPDEYREHFGSFAADTTRWVTTSSSPDVPDVAAVARRLYELTDGTRTDGAIVVDARGLAALLPPQATLTGPEGGRLTAAGIPSFVYSEAYQTLGGASDLRRDSLIDVGQATFGRLLRGGLGGRPVLEGAADALAGGHLRVVSFRPREQRALAAAGVSGDIEAAEDDVALVTVQNLGGNKLDPYARRSVRHACELTAAEARCETETTIRNRTPKGLTPYQYQYRPYGLFKNFVEIYVPAAAHVESVTADRKAVRFSTFGEDGLEALGAFLEIPRGETTTMRTVYTLPLRSDGYRLSVIPQPLTRDARVTVELAAPEGWTLRGTDVDSDIGVLRHRGTLSRTLEFEAKPDVRTGLAALWPGVARFLREPLL